MDNKEELSIGERAFIHRHEHMWQFMKVVEYDGATDDFKFVCHCGAYKLVEPMRIIEESI